MKIKLTPYFIVSFLVSLMACICFVLSAFQLYSNEDYVHTFLGHNRNSDTGAIPIAGSFLISALFLVVHILAHIKFIRLTDNQHSNFFILRLIFYKTENKLNWIIRVSFYLLAIFTAYDYFSSFYKFYFFEFLSYFFIVLTLVTYGMTITNLIENNKNPRY